MGRKRQTDRDRERDRDRETETDRQTNKQTDSFVSKVHALKTDTISACWIFLVLVLLLPPNSGVDYMIFNVHMRIHTGDLGFQSHPNDFCRVCIDFDSGEI